MRKCSVYFRVYFEPILARECIVPYNKECCNLYTIVKFDRHTHT